MGLLPEYLPEIPLVRGKNKIVSRRHAREHVSSRVPGNRRQSGAIWSGVRRDQGNAGSREGAPALGGSNVTAHRTRLTVGGRFARTRGFWRWKLSWSLACAQKARH